MFYDRESKFPNGESLNELRERAERAINDIIVPYIWRAAHKGEPAHIAIVSHGLCISELVAAVVRNDENLSKNASGHQWTGLRNTAWTRLEIDVAVRLFPRVIILLISDSYRPSTLADSKSR